MRHPTQASPYGVLVLRPKLAGEGADEDDAGRIAVKVARLPQLLGKAD
jgi:hypothetical protein